MILPSLIQKINSKLINNRINCNIMITNIIIDSIYKIDNNYYLSICKDQSIQLDDICEKYQKIILAEL